MYRFRLSTTLKRVLVVAASGHDYSSSGTQWFKNRTSGNAPIPSTFKHVAASTSESPFLVQPLHGQSTFPRPARDLGPAGAGSQQGGSRHGNQATLPLKEKRETAYQRAESHFSPNITTPHMTTSNITNPIYPTSHIGRRTSEPPRSR